MHLSPHSQDVWKSHNTERKKKVEKKTNIISRHPNLDKYATWSGI